LNAGGGIYGLPYRDYIAANGFPNTFFSWGGEDDAFGKRLIQINASKFDRVKHGHILHIDIHRKSHKSKMEYLRQNKIRSMMVHENLAADAEKWRDNGYQNLKINIVTDERINGTCIYRVAFNLDETYLAETIEHNEKIYKELGGANAL
jgi:hypothetical protein